MNELLQSIIEDASTKGSQPTVFPAANSTSAFQISAGYMHVIVAVYAIVVVLVIFIIIIIVVQSIKNSWRKKGMSGYGAIHPQRINDLNPDVETLDDNSRTYEQHQDDDSEYDNISLNLGREDNDHNEADIPPSYENPPEYLGTGDHGNNETNIPLLCENQLLCFGIEDHENIKTDTPPLYENPPSYLSINR